MDAGHESPVLNRLPHRVEVGMGRVAVGDDVRPDNDAMKTQLRDALHFRDGVAVVLLRDDGGGNNRVGSARQKSAIQLLSARAIPSDACDRGWR